MAQKQPTHLKIFLTRTVRIQKAHIAGEQAAAGAHDLMKICERGSEVTVERTTALDLIVAESAIEVKPTNAETITNAQAEIAEHKRNLERLDKSQREPLKKAA